MLKGFIEFATRRNGVDAAVGIAIGVAIGTVISTIVTVFLTPILGLAAGARGDLANFTLTIDGLPIRYGLILNQTIVFILTLILVYILIVVPTNRIMNRMPAHSKECPRCCTTIDIKATRCPNCTSVLIGVPDDPTKRTKRQ